MQGVGKEMNAFREVQTKQKESSEDKGNAFKRKKSKNVTKRKSLNWVLKEVKIEHEETGCTTQQMPNSAM